MRVVMGEEWEGIWIKETNDLQSILWKAQTSARLKQNAKM